MRSKIPQIPPLLPPSVVNPSDNSFCGPLLLLVISSTSHYAVILGLHFQWAFFLNVPLSTQFPVQQQQPWGFSFLRKELVQCNRPRLSWKAHFRNIFISELSRSAEQEGGMSRGPPFVVPFGTRREKFKKV